MHHIYQGERKVCFGLNISLDINPNCKLYEVTIQVRRTNKAMLNQLVSKVLTIFILKFL